MPAKVEKLFLHPGPQPNGLQATPDGLWVLDQTDNCVYLLDYKNGSVRKKFQTASQHGSGITVGGGYLWVASTYSCQLLKLSLKDGSTVATYDTPGAGVVSWANPATARRTGAHGLEWVDDRLWVAVPPSQTIYQCDPATMEVLHSFPAPGPRPHGIAWDRGMLWCADTSHKAVYKMDPKSGKVVDKMEGISPDPHGMTLYQGHLWFCDADTRWIFRVPL